MQLSHSEQQEPDGRRELGVRTPQRSEVKSTRPTCGFSGVPALGGGAARARAHALAVHAGAAGAGALRLPLGAVLVLHAPLHAPCSATHRSRG